MAKIKTSQYFESVSGKLGKKSDQGVMLHHKTGKMYTVNYGEFKNPNSTKQKEKRTAFATKAKAASTWWQSNKPIIGTNGTVTREASADYLKVKAAFDSQDRYNNLYVFVRSLVNAQNAVVVPGSSSAGDDPDDDRGM